ncbi:redox-sensitive transcriptional activator SoxR [Endozoicomonas montiporae]|uniref:Redox-sensitive transcriptional activator SoxR n=1 Tax=Endozoicomonas montiporae CL-33 TaxID=570277 RepID=A0A142B6E3_9GAMM|nr:redox-sensitive transcriptional activator SoxR [Endozoicomonas montiporae]AMO54319.1 redox-sensitive transcriptional activator SoxR [Endozoicomonas montiporae CL-33]
MRRNDKFLTISEVAERTGVAPSALRFYETKQLIRSIRTAGNQRRYHPSMLRQISVIQIAQKLGVTLEEIAKAFADLPENRTPNKKDWDKLARHWGKQLDERIAVMQRLRSQLNGCIGCGCLSMKHCELVNPDDAVASHGSGARYVMEEPEELFAEISSGGKTRKK